MTEYGFLVETIFSVPGQDFFVGEVIMSINGYDLSFRSDANMKEIWDTEAIAGVRIVVARFSLLRVSGDIDTDEDSDVPEELSPEPFGVESDSEEPDSEM